MYWLLHPISHEYAFELKSLLIYCDVVSQMKCLTFPEKLESRFWGVLPLFRRQKYVAFYHWEPYRGGRDSWGLWGHVQNLRAVCRTLSSVYRDLCM